MSALAQAARRPGVSMNDITSHQRVDSPSCFLPIVFCNSVSAKKKGNGVNRCPFLLLPSQSVFRYSMMAVRSASVSTLVNSWPSLPWLYMCVL